LRRDSSTASRRLLEEGVGELSATIASPITGRQDGAGVVCARRRLRILLVTRSTVRSGFGSVERGFM